ncbi:protein lifeguard 2-like isoform X2 [Gordionus sp. m RMFG-2023]|uniref:protein lifeguard 2-like isoform X2 n=1 Tax=Gordionus sp. m RMFG-2023 TaxID=3053472 RepID=UPI0031FC869D
MNRNDNYERFNENESAILFSDKTIRRGFIRKVYALLLAQLIVTCIFITIFLYVPEVKLASRQYPGIYIAALVGTFVLIIALTCFEGLRRKWPLNIIMLGVFTLFEGWLLGSISSYYGKDEVLMAVGITTIIVFSLSIFAFQTKYIIFDTQMMMGGDKKYSLSPEEYIFAALTLYLDIVNLFLYILQLINHSNN